MANTLCSLYSDSHPRKVLVERQNLITIYVLLCWLVEGNNEFEETFLLFQVFVEIFLTFEAFLKFKRKNFKNAENVKNGQNKQGKISPQIQCCPNRTSLNVHR